MAFLTHISMKSESNALKVAIIQEADPIKEKYISAIIGWLKVSQVYWHMQKKASDFGSGQNVLHTANSVLSWLFE